MLTQMLTLYWMRQAELGLGSAVRNMFEPRVRPMPWQRTGMEMPMGYFSKLGKI